MTLPVVVTSNFTADPLGAPLVRALAWAGIDAEVQFAPYNQIFQQLLDRSSQFATCTGVNILLLSIEEWLRESADKAFAEFSDLLREAAARTKGPCIVGLCPCSPETLADAERLHRLQTAERELAAEFTESSAVHVVGSAEWSAEYNFEQPWNHAAYRLGHIPYTQDFFLSASAVIARRIHALTAPPYKVLVLDCDNTLWKGVCGEDGVSGLEISEGHAALQRFAVSQQEAGMLVCLCSKNNEEDAWAVFDSRRDMILRREHITAARINWRNKSENLRELASELKLGLDSFVFIDDDTAVCAEVRARCPEVLVYQLPGEPGIGEILKRAWAFDRLRTATVEDRLRADSYRHAAERESLRQHSSNLSDFLAKLELNVRTEPCRPEQKSRVSQLTLRTNQFNSTTIRRPEPELEALLADGWQCTTVTVSDRFGEYGLVGTLLFRPLADALRVDSFLLSCRALGRGVEHGMVAYLGQTAAERGLAWVDIDFTPSAKNAPAREFLDSLPAQRVEFGYRLPAVDAAALRYDGSVSAPPQRQESASNAAPPPLAGSAERRAAGLAAIAAEWNNMVALRSGLLPAAAAAGRSVSGEYLDETEREIARLFASGLRLEAVGAEDDFLDLGGDSLLAVQVFAEIERVFDKPLTIASLFDARTPRALAKLVSESAPSKYLSLVPIQPEGSALPLYCIHAAGGNVMFYGDLARWLGKGQPVYGFEAVGLDKKRKPHDRVEDMAAHYVAELLDFQPVGPYHLCGSSFGGLVAFEMARQLRLAGREAGLVALLDTYGPGYPRYKSRWARTWSRLLIRVQTQAGNLALLSWSERLAYIQSKASKARRLASRRVKQGRNEFMRSFYEKTGRELPEHLVVAQNAIEIARQTYRPQLYQGEITLLRASTQPTGIFADPALGWSAVAPALTVHEIAGTHGAVTMDPHARSTAEVLSRCLAPIHGSRRAACVA